MSTPAFAQPERRSFLVPILIALAAIAVAILIAIHFFPATTINIENIHTSVLPTETVFKGSTIVGVAETNHMLLVASTVRVDNQLRVPIYLDDMHLAFTTPENTQVIVNATEKKDLPDLETNYPGLKPLITTPLVRNTEIDPGKSAEGTIVFSLQVPKDMWDKRQSAVVKVEIYHQPAVYLTIPK